MVSLGVAEYYRIYTEITVIQCPLFLALNWELS